MHIDLADKVIPVCSHPTTVIIVDDNMEFIGSIAITLASDRSMERFEEPKTALDYINNELVKKTLLNINPDVLENIQKNNHSPFDIKCLRQNVNNRGRFKDSCVVLIDYAMPSMNGFDFCKNIKHNNMCRLMLTGETESTIAIEGFNQGIIHQFVRKDDKEVISLVLKYIAKNERKAFEKESRCITELLAHQQNTEADKYCLFDPGYIAFFNRLLVDHDVCEYYLYDPFGSYLFINPFGNKSYFFVRSEDDISQTIKAAETAKLPQEIIEAIKNHKKMLILDNNSEIPTDWKQRLLSIEGQFEGFRKYYYVCTHVIPFDEVEYDIYPYLAYLENG